MSTIADSDVTEMNGDTVDDAADALLARFMPEGDPDAKKKPSEESETKVKPESKKPEPEDETETDEETPADEEETDEEGEPAEKAKKFVEDGDDVFTKVKEGDEEHEVPLKDLKRLWGQEKALTRKSQEVAKQRETADAETVKSTAVLAALLQRAEKAAEPYSKIDFLVASKSLTAEELTALRTEANARFEDVKFLKEELGGFVKGINDKQQAAFTEQAKACVASLKDAESPHHIPEWGDKVYGELRDFAVDQGLDVKVFNQLVDPAAMKLLNMAMQFKRGQSKVLTTKVNKQPKKIIKTSSTPVPSKGTKAAADKAMRKLQTDQSTEAAADVFLKRWEDKAGDE
jgi:hypothetical protein